MSDWTPPFCSQETGLTCPLCKKENTVQAREKETYYDADEVAAYCQECHANLHVYSTVEISFSDPEPEDGGDE